MLTCIVPTLNAATVWPLFARALRAATPPETVLILDSSSTDGTPQLARDAGFAVHTLAREDFNHGGTRQLGVDLAFNSDILVFLTQDAVLADPTAIARLVGAFADPAVAVSYGRQLPRPGARGIEAHARLFNYPPASEVRDLASRERLGFKAAFLSNSFAAYRRTALAESGGFPRGVIFGEDTVTAGRLLLAGWKIAYVAEARVYHSHGYSCMQEFRRSFDIGVLHRRERWLLDCFGEPDGEGMRFVRSELKYLRRVEPGQIPSALGRTAMKLAGYWLGRMEHHLKPAVKRWLSMHRAFWLENV